MIVENNNSESETFTTNENISDIDKPSPAEGRDFKIRTINDYITFEKEVVIPEGDATDAGRYPIFYVANVHCFVMGARLRHGVNGSTGATVDVEKLTSGTAKGSGTSVLSSVFDISAGANTPQKRTVVATSLTTINLEPGDALALKAAGTLTGASNVTVGVLLGANMKNIPPGLAI